MTKCPLAFEPKKFGRWRNVESVPVSGELRRWKRNDRIRKARRPRAQTPDGLIGSFPKVDRRRSDRESLESYAATGVWYRLRQCGCHRNERRFAIGRDTGVSCVRP